MDRTIQPGCICELRDEIRYIVKVNWVEGDRAGVSYITMDGGNVLPLAKLKWLAPAEPLVRNNESLRKLIRLRNQSYREYQLSQFRKRQKAKKPKNLSLPELIARAKTPDEVRAILRAFGKLPKQTKKKGGET